MTIKTINIGTNPNDNTGEGLRDGLKKVNDNFTDPANAASRQVGTAAGEVSVNYGDGENPLFTGDLNTVNDQKTLYVRPDQGAINAPVANNGYFYVTPSSVSGYFLQDYTVGFGPLSGERFLRVYSAAGGGFTSWFKQLSTRNTTVDSNGFIKSASPIINLFDDHLTGNADADVTLTKTGTGVYVLDGVEPLAESGWYIETPKDRNGNIYFTLDYDQDLDNRTLTIRTYTPDYSTGPATNGAPVDILPSRFVALRFNEPPASELPEPGETEEE